MSLASFKPQDDSISTPEESNPFHLAAAEGAVSTLSALLKTELARSFPVAGLDAKGRSVLGAALPFCRGESGASLVRELIAAGCDPASVEPVAKGADHFRHRGLQSAFEAAAEANPPGSRRPRAPLGLVALVCDPVAGAALWQSLSKDQKSAVASAGGLGVAARAGRLDKLDELVAAGADPNAPDAAGVLPLSMAATSEAVRRLLELGADLSARDAKGKSALEIMMGRQSQGQQDKEMAKVAAEWMAAKTPKPAAKAPAPSALSDDQSALAESAFGAFKERNLNAARYAIQALGASAALARGEKGQTLLHAAIHARSSALAKTLLKKGCDPFAADDQGESSFLLMSALKSQGGYGSQFDPSFSKIASELSSSHSALPWTQPGPDGRLLVETFFGVQTRFGQFWNNLAPWALSAGWDPRAESTDGLCFSQRALLACVEDSFRGDTVSDAAVPEYLAFLRKFSPHPSSAKSARAVLDAIAKSEKLASALSSDEEWSAVPRWAGLKAPESRAELRAMISSVALACAQQADLSDWSAPETLSRVCPEFAAAVETRALSACSAPGAARSGGPALRV